MICLPVSLLFQLRRPTFTLLLLLYNKQSVCLIKNLKFEDVWKSVGIDPRLLILGAG